MKIETLSDMIYAVWKGKDGSLVVENGLKDLLTTYMKIHHYRFVGLITIDEFMAFLEGRLFAYVEELGVSPLDELIFCMKMLTEGIPPQEMNA